MMGLTSKENKNTCGKNKAVSEIISYLLLFTMVFVVLSMILMQAYPELQKQREIVSIQVMENTFTVLQDVEKLVSFNVVPSKTVYIRADIGEIYANSSFGKVNFTINSTKSQSFKYGVLGYSVGTSKILLDNNAVVGCFEGGCVMLSNPWIFRENNTVYISIFNINSSMSLAGAGQILLSYKGKQIYDGYANNLTITFQNPTSSVWVKFFNESLKFEKLNDHSVRAKNINYVISIYNLTVS